VPCLADALADHWGSKVFAVVPEKNRVILTLKKSLLSSELPVLSGPADAKVGLDVDGVVTQIMEKGMLLDLFGGLRALVPIGEAT
jgi:rRNA biogenesis protein RRP5